MVDFEFAKGRGAEGTVSQALDAFGLDIGAAISGHENPRGISLVGRSYESIEEPRPVGVVEILRD